MTLRTPVTLGVALLLLLMASGGHATRVAPRVLSSAKLSEDSSCVVKYPGWSMKPDEGNWSKKLEDVGDVDECLAECGPDDGFSGIVHSAEKGTCYCWKGEAGKDWKWEESDSTSYVISACGGGDDSSEESEDSSSESEKDSEEDSDGLVKDDEGRIRGDLSPFSCSGDYDEAGWIYGPEGYGCNDWPGYYLKPGDAVKGVNGAGWQTFKGDFSMCRAIARANVYGDLEYPTNLPCFRCYVTITDEGHCHFQSSCGPLRYGEGEMTALDCGMT